jgi:hypothetical protein
MKASSKPMESVAIFESEHPYRSNMDQMMEMSFPNAIRITIEFVNDSRTEQNYDYVRFWKSSDKRETWHPTIDKFTGRGGSENWPGCGGRPAFVIEGDSAFIEWHSDGSNEDWGWKLTATAEFKPEIEPTATHWMIQLEEILVSCGASAANALIISMPWNGEKEDTTSSWLEDDLFGQGTSDGMSLQCEPVVRKPLLHSTTERRWKLP